MVNDADVLIQGQLRAFELAIVSLLQADERAAVELRLVVSLLQDELASLPEDEQARSQQTIACLGQILKKIQQVRSFD